MAETNCHLNQSHQQNPSVQSLFQAIDHISLILSQNSADSDQPVLLKLTTENYIMERGPRYRAKEKRKPRQELTPPSKNVSKTNNGFLSNSRRSKSANAREKMNGGLLMARESYASVEELKGLSLATANTINGDNRGNRGGRGVGVGVGKNVLGYRKF
ncbi:hypothetical protein Peur_052945 [Populus x canadensis]